MLFIADADKDIQTASLDLSRSNLILTRGLVSSLENAIFLDIDNLIIFFDDCSGN